MERPGPQQLLVKWVRTAGKNHVRKKLASYAAASPPRAFLEDLLPRSGATAPTVHARHQARWRRCVLECSTRYLSVGSLQPHRLVSIFPSLLVFLLSVGLSRTLVLASLSKDQITIDDWTRRKDHVRNINGNNMGNEDKVSEPLSSRLLGTKSCMIHTACSRS